jgi:alkanesulfonate monooxygenase SsuD/methylene tetrahydromethanopterin reductase-like flavin-dependent oxidoreductase (luciferase family)
MTFFGVYLPNFGECSSPQTLVELVCQTEKAGWDGFFLWDHLVWSRGLDVIDPWIALAGVAVKTERIKIGPLITPLARRRPWKVARESVTLDHLSNGRLVLGVGLGNPPDLEFKLFGEDDDARVRAEKLDEGLGILLGLWSGEPYSFKGRHFQVQETQFLPTPLQVPRIPIWVAGKWPNRAPFRRAAHWDGVFPLPVEFGERLTPEGLRKILAYVGRYRPKSYSQDVVVKASTPDDPEEGSRIVRSFAEAGMTWWLEDLYQWRDSAEGMSSRILRRPPREHC